MSAALRRRPGRLRRLLVCLLVPVLAAGPGCTRRYYRNRADKEVQHLLEQKQAPDWDLDGYHLDPDLRARFADDTCRDRPPMPPDDPAASQLCPNPQKPYKKSGVGLVEGTGYLEMLDEWDRANRAERQAQGSPEGTDEQASFAQLIAASRNPTPEQLRSYAERQARRELADPVTTKSTVAAAEVEKAISRERTFLIKLEQAVELGLVNSREYQTRREGLYLAALPVTVERFAFAPQLFASEVAVRERLGQDFPGGPARRWRFDTNAGFTQLFSTGGLLLLGFANRTILNLGSARDSSISTLSLGLVQPLLRGAGRAVTLEPWTQAERNLLYAVRDFVRFRQEFFVFIAAGQPTFIPGVEAGVQAVTGGTVGVPAPVGPTVTPIVAPPLPLAGVFPQILPGDGGRLAATGTGGAPPQGYLSTLTQKARLINQYRNIVSLGRYLSLFRVFLEGSLVDAVQVGQVEQNLLRGINTVLAQQASFRNNLDQFKLQLGIPLGIPLEVDDGPLQPLFDQTRRFENLSAQYEQLVSQAQQYARPSEAGQLRGRLNKLLLDSPLTRETGFAKNFNARLGAWTKMGSAADPKKDPLNLKLDALIAQRETLVTLREKLRDKDQDLPPKDAARLEEIEAQLDLGLYERALRDYEARPWEKVKDEAVRATLQVRLFNTVFRQFLSFLESPRGEKLEAIRPRWPDLPTLCVDGVDLLRDDDDKALAAVSRAALENRLDLMNRRAQLTDSWRKIRVAANALMGVLNVEYRYDVNTPANVIQPFNFGGSRQRHQLAFNGELPLVRIQERNNYRATLIAYQQQRRALQLAEDQVLFAVRLELRQLRAAANNYHRVQKRAVELAYVQVDQALQAFNQPQAPAGPAQPPGLVGPPAAGGRGGDPAALTQQLLQAQNALLAAQNDLYDTWVNYVTTRMSLYRDVGLMPLDPRGVWIEEEVTSCDQACAAGCPPGAAAPAAAPGGVPIEIIREPGTPEVPPQVPAKLPAPRAEGRGGIRVFAAQAGQR